MLADVINYGGGNRARRLKAKDGYKFQENGLWGLKSKDGETLLDAKYNQIEVCSDYVYAHYGNRHTCFYYDGHTSDSADRDDDYRFYNDGKIGFLDKNGNVLLPPIYDEIIDWGEECDVIYTRTGTEFHYYNRNKEEILTAVDYIPEDKYPECPYNLGEDQNRYVLLCVEPAGECRDEYCCYAYNQWVKLSRIPRKNIADIFSSCSIAPLPAEALRNFYDNDTYIYSARYCKADGATPIKNCIEKIESLDAYESSWVFLVKIAVNRNTKIDSNDLYTAIKYFEDMEYYCIDYHISIGYDDSLADGEVSVFQVHYFYDDGGAFLYDDILQHTLPEGTLEEVVDAVNDSENRDKLLDSAYYWIKYSENRSWDETRKVLDWLYMQGTRGINDILKNSLYIHNGSIDEIDSNQWAFKKEIVKWALEHGANINLVIDGKTFLEKILDEIERAKKYDKENECECYIEQAIEFCNYLRALGATSAVNARKEFEKRFDVLSLEEIIKSSKR